MHQSAKLSYVFHSSKSVDFLLSNYLHNVAGRLFTCQAQVIDKLISVNDSALRRYMEREFGCVSSLHGGSSSLQESGGGQAEYSEYKLTAVASIASKPLSQRHIVTMHASTSSTSDHAVRSNRPDEKQRSAEPVRKFATVSNAVNLQQLHSYLEPVHCLSMMPELSEYSDIPAISGAVKFEPPDDVSRQDSVFVNLMSEMYVSLEDVKPGQMMRVM
uniref:Uncharacterized protein n=1 Tax=Plectus sambesii TaxID=2011161 RepID=A0A914UG97_9BILA